MSIFGSENIITEHISKADLRAYFVSFDFDRFRLDELVDVLLDALVDFAFGYHKGILKNYNRKILREAAKSIYKIDVFEKALQKYVQENSEFEDDLQDKYLKRGEFGELILHLILRDFINTIPLISKIYFKDSDGVPVHGFDAVHIGPDLRNENINSIYFGESKLYNNGKKGVIELLNDIETHFERNFLQREFVLIGKKRNAFEKLEKYNDKNTKEEYSAFLEQKEFWFDKLDDITERGGKLQKLFSSVTIPLLCTYTSELFSKYSDEQDKNFLKEYEEEIRKLKGLFDKKFKEMQSKYKNSGQPIQSNLNIVVMLFPVPNKKELVKTLHQKLSKIQEI